MSGADHTPAPGAPEPSPSPRPGVGADEALAGFVLLETPLARPLDRVRLAPVVAGALRAALDALAGDLGARAGLRVTADDAVLEVRLDRVDARGLVPAGGVLETVEASLAPAAPGARQWVVRTPVLSSAESFLMIERDGLALALPWHAVSRVRMVRARDLAALAAQEDAGVAEGFGADPALDDDVPAVLVALGLRRAWLAVDRLVWRLPATPDPAMPPPPRADLGPALLTADGGRYWLLDPILLLRHQEFRTAPGEDVAPELPAFVAEAPAPAPPPAPEPPVAVEPPPAVPAPAAPQLVTESLPVVIPAFEPAARPVLRLVTLTADDVTPLDAAAFADLGVVPEPEPAVEPAPASVAAARPARPRVLVAEDSITARMFLGRLLETMGFEIHAVTSLRELRGALERGPWAIVMVDVELPDARGARVLTGLAADSGRGPAPVVALVRDAEDAAIARSAGVPHTLRKPFERDDLERLLIALHWQAPDA